MGGTDSYFQVLITKSPLLDQVYTGSSSAFRVDT